MRPPCIVNHKGRTPLTLQSHYDVAALKLDTLKVDQVFRVKKAESPSPGWYGTRARLNRFIVSVKSIDDDYVVLRIK